MKLSTLSGGKKTKPATTSKRKDASKPISEEEVLKKETITPADVCNLETYTKGKRLTLMAMAVELPLYCVFTNETTVSVQRVPVFARRQYIRH